MAKKKYDKISVIFPIFGNFNFKSLFLAIESVRIQSYPNIEIIVSEQNDSPEYKKMAREQGVVYIYVKPRKKDNGYNVGHIRNCGIKKASGKYVYLNDSDIVFINKNYLSLLINRMKKIKFGFMMQPPMKRLVVKDFQNFYISVSNFGITSAISNLSFVDGHTTSKDKKNPIKIVPYGWRNRKMTVFRNEWKKITKKDLDSDYGYGLMSFTFHCGGIFVERKKLLRVGGYCEDFEGWGFDDIDLQIKLEAINREKSSVFIPKRKSYDVLHLDHKRNFRRRKYEINKKIFEVRKNSNPKNLFLLDRKTAGFR